MSFQLKGIEGDSPRLAFVVHLVAYTVSSVAFFLLDLFVIDKRRGDKPGQITWAYWPIMGWGIGVLVHAWVTFSLLAGDDGESETPPPGIMIPLS